jgi:hypothetical protein
MENNNNFKFHKILNAASNDECRGLTYDENKKEISILVYSNSADLKQLSTSNYDVFIIIISDSGIAQRGKQISLSSKTSSTTTTNLGYNVLRRSGDYYIYAGYASGFYTKIQSASFSSSKTNTFVNKYLMDKDNSYSCLYEQEVSSGTISGFISNPASSPGYSVVGSMTTSNSQLTYLSKYFAIYSSPYSGAFDLLDTMYIPRPCA